MRILALIGMLICCLVTGAPAEPSDAPPAPGASLAKMALPDLQGKLHRMKDVKAKRVVVVCWAYWCDTWKAALPQLLALSEEKDELNCEIWTVSVDGTCTAEVRGQAAKIPFPLLLDTTGAWKKQLGLRRVPTVLILDESRTVTRIFEGYPGNNLLESALRQMP